MYGPFMAAFRELEKRVGRRLLAHFKSDGSGTVTTTDPKHTLITFRSPAEGVKKAKKKIQEIHDANTN